VFELYQEPNASNTQDLQIKVHIASKDRKTKMQRRQKEMAGDCSPYV
jgi:soluble P-type ATPase